MLITYWIVIFFVSAWLISVFLFRMASLRSKDSHFVFGFPSQLKSDQLPTKQNLYCHSLFLRRERIASGEWLKNVSTQTVALAVAHDCAEVWNLTGIPHQLNDNGIHYIVQKIKVLIEEGNKLKKIPKNRRSDNTFNSFDILCDELLLSNEFFCVLSEIEFKGSFVIWFFEFGHNVSFRLLSQIAF